MRPYNKALLLSPLFPEQRGGGNNKGGTFPSPPPSLALVAHPSDVVVEVLDASNHVWDQIDPNVNVHSRAPVMHSGTHLCSHTHTRTET